MRGAVPKIVGNAAVDETGSAIEPHRVRVGCHLQALRTSQPQNLHDAVDERGGNPTSPPPWIYEQVLQFEDATGLGPRAEANKCSFFFRDIGASLGQSLGPQN
jgi:hypothetical protein